MTEEELKQEAEDYATKRASKLYTRNMWDRYYQTYIDSAKPREKEIKSLGERCLQLQKDKGELIDKVRDLEAENERITTKYYELQETLKKVRLALIKERTANIMNYGKGGVEMFDSMFEILKGVSN